MMAMSAMPTAEVSRVTQRLVDHERGELERAREGKAERSSGAGPATDAPIDSATDPAAAAAVPTMAAERALQKLRQPLGRLVGVEGCDALVMRAQRMAGSERERRRDVDTPDAAVLAHVIGLLVIFIGSDLTTRALRGTWPDVPDIQLEAEFHSGEPSAGSEKGQT